jgi:hypothetical protein
VNRTVTLPHVFAESESTGRIDNFAGAAGRKKVRFKGYFFNHSDVYKAIEGASLILRSHPDAAVDSSLHGFIELIAAAQEADGYIYTARTLAGPDYMPPGGPERWSDIRTGHELYCMGHLYEAAAAHFEATGKRTLLDVAVKNADLVCATFGPGLRSSPPGHQEIELGLVKLGRLTGNPRYVAMAEFFLEARGRGDGRQLYGEDAQDHLPVCGHSTCTPQWPISPRCAEEKTISCPSNGCGMMLFPPKCI